MCLVNLSLCSMYLLLPYQDMGDERDLDSIHISVKFPTLVTDFHIKFLLKSQVDLCQNLAKTTYATHMQCTVYDKGFNVELT